MNGIFNKKIMFLLFFLILSILLVYLIELLIPFLIGLLVAYLLDPFVDYLEEKKINRAISTTIILSSFFLIILILSFLIIPILSIQLKSFLIEFPIFIDTLNQKINFAIEYLQKKAFQEKNSDLLNNILPNFSNLLIGFLKNIVSSSLAVFNIIAIILVTPIVAWYFLKDWDNILKNINGLLPSKQKKNIIKYVKEVDLIFSAYLRGQILVSLFLTFFYFSSFYILGLNYSLFIGIFAGFFSFIPLIGIIVSFFITALLAYLQFLDILIIFYISLIFLVAQLLESNYLTPKLIGKKLGLHPLAVLFSIFVFGALLGIIGIVFATPIMAVIVFIFKSNFKY
jgi:predicted PurR-regulated permease PerM